MLDRISILKDKMLSQPRFVSIEQALIITRTYQENEDKSIPYKRALSLYNALSEIEIGMEPEELIVGNRTKGVRYGVVFRKVEFLGWIVNLKQFQHVLKISLMCILKILKLFVR